MTEPDRPQSPFAGMADSARTPLRVLSPDEIERKLAEHRLYPWRQNIANPREFFHQPI
jgi:hypothetical protein